MRKRGTRYTRNETREIIVFHDLSGAEEKGVETEHPAETNARAVTNSFRFMRELYEGAAVSAGILLSEPTKGPLR